MPVVARRHRARGRRYVLALLWGEIGPARRCSGVFRTQYKTPNFLNVVARKWEWPEDVGAGE
jgi:hypothetical protein